ncbi:MAG TPA: lipocalin-like domain-containing protein [Anaerolineales bacterium]|nr:lipocalin-like domain-containing protein [Anaerolineales bacterium]
MSRTLLLFLFLLTACAPASLPSASVQMPELDRLNEQIPSGFRLADGSLRLSFPRDFGAHEDFRAEWWYYTGNLETPEGRHFGFELTIFRVGLLPPTVELPEDSEWFSRSLYFAHFALSDIQTGRFHAFERYSRPGPGLAGAQPDPYRVWIEDWSVTGSEPGVYSLQAAQDDIALDLTLTDEMGVVLHGENGYSRKGESASNASYYYSQPRLRAEGAVQVDGARHTVSGLAWKDHEFSTSALDENQTGWDWFSLQFESGEALMLFQLRERGGGISPASSGTFIAEDGTPKTVGREGFDIVVLDQWRSPHTGGVYPAAWQVGLRQPDCVLDIAPWMADQEIHFPAVTYWEGAVRFEGTCNGQPARGNGYVELTGYAGNLPLP